MSPELRSRVLVAVVGLPAGAVVGYLGGWFLAVVVAVMAGVAAHEFYTLASARSGQPLGWLGIPVAAGLVLLAQHDLVFPAWGDRALGLLMFLGLATSAAVIFSRKIDEGPLLSASATVSGALYTGGTLSFAIFLRNLPEARGAFPAEAWEGPLLLMFPLCVTWAGDTAAYFAGRRLGRVRLAPQVSPGKTVEGGIAGLAGAVAAGLCAGFLLDDYQNFPVSPLAGALIGLALGVAGQLGDLAESVFKREAGVKDSGGLLRGHGGALDRFDGLFFTIPLAYALILVVQLAR